MLKNVTPAWARKREKVAPVCVPGLPGGHEEPAYHDIARETTLAIGGMSERQQKSSGSLPGKPFILLHPAQFPPLNARPWLPII